jgi:hypothetical protein
MKTSRHKSKDQIGVYIRDAQIWTAPLTGGWRIEHPAMPRHEIQLGAALLLAFR